MIKILKYRFETLLATAFAVLAPFFPTVLWRRLGRLFGAAAYHLLPIRRAVARHTLRVLSPGLEPVGRERLIRRSYQNLAVSLFEFFTLSRGLAHAGLPRVRHPEIPRALARAGRGVIMISIHYGNWEWIGPYLAHTGVRVHYIVRKQNNPQTGAIFDAIRRAAGVGIITRDYALRGIFEKLRAGDWVGFLCDQDGRESGVPVNFFGQRVSWTRGPAFFSLRLGLPILPVLCRRGGDFTPTIEFLPPILPSGEADDLSVQRLSQSIATLFEKEIALDPGPWMIFHRRFGR